MQTYEMLQIKRLLIKAGRQIESISVPAIQNGYMSLSSLLLTATYL